MPRLTDGGLGDVARGFRSALAALGPFERRPRVAAGVSGGPDSTALGWLLLDWVREVDGHLTIISVDHGLRAGAAEDCRFVADAFASASNADVIVVTWRPPAKTTGIQAAARAARYDLLAHKCRALGIVHLFTGHTLDDQAETVAMRAAHASTAYGLAAMPACRPLNGVRLLRPLLGIRRGDLMKWLVDQGRSWREDPSNLSERFERVRHRKAIAESGNAFALARTARALGEMRDQLERNVADLFAKSCQILAAGYAEIDAAAILAAPTTVASLAWMRLLRTIGGREFPASPKAIARLAHLVQQGGHGTLAGCALFRRKEKIVACREPTDQIEIRVGDGPWRGQWDNRFRVCVSVTGPWRLTALGEDGVRQLSRRHGVNFKRHPIPVLARRSAPALWREDDLIAAPIFAWGTGLKSAFCPVEAATGAGFPVARGEVVTM